MTSSRFLAGILILSSASVADAEGTTEFCLEGELDLGARYQGSRPASGEFYPTSWCVITEDESQRVSFTGAGRSNPDMDGGWTVAYLGPELVRIVNRDSPPDVEFRGADSAEEARRVRRIDPRRLLEEFMSTPASVDGAIVEIADERVIAARTSAALPLRGRVDVDWLWDWSDRDHPELRLMLDGELLFRASGRWRNVPDDEAAAVWTASTGADPIEVPGDRWPASINMQLIKLTDDVYVVRGVRTGFQHMIVDTDEGLVVADAPAGWVEFHHLPPSDLVPGLGVSGLSENFVDFLREEFPGRPIRAVALTHFHDDHAGGARAFAAEGADVLVSAASARFFETAFNRESMPRDRLSRNSASVRVSPVTDEITIGDEPNRVRVVSIGPGPHSYAMLGVWAIDRGYFFVSDVHVPNSDADEPRGNRAATECWFARWAVSQLPADTSVINSHSTPVTPVSRLARYLDSDLCSAGA